MEAVFICLVGFAIDREIRAVALMRELQPEITPTVDFAVYLKAGDRYGCVCVRIAKQ